MSYNSKYTGQQVEALLDMVSQGGGTGGEGGSSGSGGGDTAKEVVYVFDGVIEELEPNKVYIYESSNLEFEIQSIQEPYEDYAEYHVIFEAQHYVGSVTYTPTITLPDNINWANGNIPDLTEQGIYELSIVYWFGVNDSGYNAVITKFKTIW